MINREEYLHIQPQKHSITYFVDNLLQEPYIGDQLFAQKQSQTIKYQIEPQEAESDCSVKSPLSINILDKQQYPFPAETFFENVRDYRLQDVEPIEEIHLNLKSCSPKKSQKTNKSSYLQQTRAIKIQRYKYKKTKRIWNRKISYDCRKMVADSRERINGRFVKKSPISLNLQPFEKSSCKPKDFQVLRQFNEDFKI